jgi:predicted nuclease of restriction endonuclease-like (RecB) superfamily
VSGTPERASESVELLRRIRDIWLQGRQAAARSVNSAHVTANWLIGQQIVEAEQAGAARAAYGTQLLETLAADLRAEFGSGFSLSSLKYMRSFYLEYPGLLEIGHASRDQLGSTPKEPESAISHAVRGVSAGRGTEREWVPGTLHPALSWTHYRTLLKVAREEARAFYEIEAIRGGWSSRQLDRQINSLLFERLFKSRDKAGVMSLANDGLSPSKPSDVIRDPYVLEFLNLPESHLLVESRVEEALLTHLQAFLLELGSGFAFIGRQLRLTLDGDHFYPDLVFYHVKLKCYVIIDLKVDKLSHADLGQMQLYVNYYNREIAEPGDQPTIGLVLCTDKNDAMVRYVLSEDNQQIFASRYQFHLPTEETLKAELRRELDSLPQPGEES